MTGQIWKHGNDGERPSFRYRGCGLDDVYLVSGFEVKETPHGKAVSIRDLDGLHRAIGLDLVDRRKPLSGKDIRFLRADMDLTQVELARMFGCDSQQVARYEKGENRIPGPADRLLRMIYRNHVGGDVDVRAFLKALDRLDERTAKRRVYAATKTGWKLARAA
ncbi:MAG: helix-turn-helix domain-containing protein [Alphaproteobacteria bacterium]|nr:helix-turn-helix domain-containing protein [Alphaproteobacteria bacterium]